MSLAEAASSFDLAFRSFEFKLSTIKSSFLSFSFIRWISSLIPNISPRVRSMYAMYSKPNTCPQPTLYSNGPALMTPAGSPRSVHTKPMIMLDTDFDTYMPSTPPLSASGSTVGSPASYEALQTPMNPMFSGLENGECVKEIIEPVDAAVLDWSSCGSPPLTPSKFSYIHC